VGICQQVFVQSTVRPFVKAPTLFVLLLRGEIQMPVFQTVSIGGMQKGDAAQKLTYNIILGTWQFLNILLLYV